MQEIRFQIPIPVDGVRKDLAQNAVPPSALIESQNMILRRGRFQPRYGVVAFASNKPSQKVKGVIGYRHSDGTDKLVIGTEAGWWRYNSGTTAWVDISGTALAASDHIIFRVFQKDGATHLLGINNQVSTMKKWDGAAATYSAVGGTPPLAKAMMVLANRVLLFNLADNGAYSGVISPVGYDVSAFNDFDSGWGSVLNGLLVDTPGPIVAALEMGDLQGAIYKTDAIVMAIAQAATVPFRFEWRVIGNIGPANSRCVVAIPDGSHVFLAPDGSLNRFDGVSVQSLGYHIQKQILDSCDGVLSQLETTGWLFFDPERNEIQIHYKDASSSQRLWCVVSLENSSVWPMLWGGSEMALDDHAGGRVVIPGLTGTHILYFSTLGQAYKETLAEDVTGTTDDIAVIWETPLSDLGAPGYWKTLNSMDHLFQCGVDDPRNPTPGSETIVITARYSDGGEVPADADAGQNITISASQLNSYTTDHRATGKLMGVKYSGTIDVLFEYRGASGAAVLRGER